MSKTFYVLAAGSIVIATLSLIGLNRSRKKRKKELQGSDHENHDSVFMEDRILYINEVIDEEHFNLTTQKPTFRKTITSLSYDIILNLNKGTTYEGVIKLNIQSQKNKGNVQNLIIDFNGKCLLFLAVNDRKIEEEEVIFKRHQIVIKKEWLQKNQNTIQIIFSNKYAFMGDGLTTYFLLDDNKYSLKGQTIYSRNGAYQAIRLFPCLNVLNPCQIKLQVLHPQGFHSFSNTPKSLDRLCSKQDYPQYTFFFEAQQRKLNRSFKLNSSRFENNSSIRSTDEIIKHNTQFYDSNLSSIHGFFLLSSSVYEVRPNVHKSYSSDILIRYFVKEHCMKKTSNFISILHYQIMEISARLQKYLLHNEEQIKISHQIDVFFIDDFTAQGSFYTGAIYLNEEVLDKVSVDMRIFYLLCRAVIGMGLSHRRQDDILGLEGKLKLNQLTLQIFPQCNDFIYLRQHEFTKIKRKCLNFEQNSFMRENEHWIQEYYEKQCRFLVKSIQKQKISKNVKQLMQEFEETQREQFWAHFISCHQFIELTASEVIMKIGIRSKGIPTDETTLAYIKENLVKSKYYIKFFTNAQVQSDLKRFIELNSYGLEKRIPFIKIKERYKKYIKYKIQNYLAIKSNRLQAKNLYEQFKRYNQSRNFHHISILRRQIKRVKILASQFITTERRDLECSLTGWKLLRKILIFPKDEFIFRLLEELEEMNHQ